MTNLRQPIIGLLLCGILPIVATAQTPFAVRVVAFEPAPGQWVNDPLYNDASRALGAPLGGDPGQPGNESLASLGGFGGRLVLAFDHTVMDDAANPFGLDAIVYGNALYVSGNANRRWAECGTIEISRDVNGNGVADDPWYLIPGSHLTDLVGQHETQTWDDDIADPTWPPDDDFWLPPGQTGQWTTAGWRLPPAIFDVIVLQNPFGNNATAEGVWGYADLTPTVGLPPGASPAEFYTRPDNPFAVGLTPGSGGGDAFDIAWAVDPLTGAPVNLDGFDFIRITTAVNRVLVSPPLGELSTEIDAVADVVAGRLGDVENDGDVDLDDFMFLEDCFDGPGVSVPPSPCRVVDMDQDSDLDLHDCAVFAVLFGRE